MRTHTTLTLRNLVVHDMDVNKHKLTQQEINVWVETLPCIVEEMHNHLHFFYYSIFAKSLVRKQIQQVQRECIYLLDVLSRYAALPKITAPLQKAAIKCLDLILEKIYTEYNDYANVEVYMPLLQLKKEHIKLENQLDVLRTGLIKNSIDDRLQKVIMETFNDVLKFAAHCTKFNF